MNMIDRKIVISGYCITKELYAGSRNLVCRGIREQDQKAVVIKLMRNQEYPSFNELVQFRNQYSIAKNLDTKGIVKPLSLESYGNGYALIMEDKGEISLQEWLKEKKYLSLDEFFPIASQIVDILSDLINQRVIHKDIKPANILINPESKQIKLIDFSISSLLPREAQQLQNPHVLEGTLAYISPEQTGRMNRGIDYRSDFYSLGVTFFELLTGRLPFNSDDVMELVHYHLAKQPPFVNSHQAVHSEEIPQVLSDIIIKLMAKNAEDRYQSASGLKYDLELSWQHWQETGSITHFELATRDICERFIIPEKLYGREKEVETLLAAFERVSGAEENSNCQAELMLVAGFSGIGKTAVVNEVHKPIVRQRGYFVKGKFDQFQRNIPLGAFVQAFRDLMGQLLGENHIQLQQWRINIQETLGENGQVIVDVIPELEQIIGKQPAVTELSGSAAQNRFNLLFLKFIQVFTTKEHPLVIFLDDLQWADSASLKLIELLMQTDTGYLLIIGAYRDNEVYPTHPLILTLEEIQKTGAVINTITLAPLAESDLNYLVADSLDCLPEIASPLTELIYQKTHGNPFFSTQFLKSLYEDKLINYIPSQFPLNKQEQREVEGGWQCDIAKVRKLALTDDVVEFMALQLQKLPNSTQEALKLAACIGNQFDVNTLSIVYGQSRVETASNLWKAMQEGFILPTTEVYKFYQSSGNEQINQQLSNFDKQSAKYKFLHDRVQQAAYSLIPDDKKQTTHLKIGQQLLENIAVEEREDKIFEIVNQLNVARDLIIEPDKRHELAQLNLIAAKKAKASTAYTAATQYLTMGRKLLDSQCWKTHYQLTLELHDIGAEVAYLGGDFSQMEELIAVVLKQANTLLDKVKVYEVKIQAWIAQNQPVEAEKVVLNVVKLLGIKFPNKPTTPHILLSFLATKAAYLGKPIESLYDISEMTSVPKSVTTRLLSKALTAAYIGSPQLLPLLIFKKVNLYLKYGNNTWSSLTYAWYGLILCGPFGDIPSGYKFGELALRLLKKFDTKEIETSVNFVVYTFIKHWQIHVRETLTPLLEGYHSGLNTGDLDYAALSIMIHFQHSYFSGLELSELEQKLALYGESIAQIKQETSLNYQNTLRQFVLNLMGESEDVCVLKGIACDEEKMFLVQTESNDKSGIYLIQLCKGTLSYLFGEYTQAVAQFKFGYPYLESATALFSLPSFYFYDSLANLAALSQNDFLENNKNKNHFLKQVNKNQKQMKKWADNAPMNHLHKYYLVEAEKYRVLNHKTQAIDYYDLAIKGAKANEYLHEEAIANELAAKFYLEWEKEQIAQTYLIQAYYCYARWGAKAKVEDLEKRYPELLAPVLNQDKQAINSNETISLRNTTTFHSTNTGTSLLDLATVTKASQAISGVLELKHLLNTLMQVVMENAGASKCALLMPKGNNLVIEAISSTVESETFILPSIPLESNDYLPIKLINYVARTQKYLLISDTKNLPLLNQISFLENDSYIQQQRPQTILCNPILNQGKLIGILYLENKLTPGAFTKDRVSLLNLICSQAAISLENARLYQQAQDYAQQLENYLTELKQAQLKLVQGEKMSALGNLVAGVAHEINNPVGFIAGNLKPALEYVKDVFGLIDLYQEKFPDSDEEIEEEIEAIDLEYLREDLPKLIFSMQEGVNRIRNISTSLRTFSRADTEHKVAFNIHEGIDSTIMILKHRLKANENRPEIKIIKEYGDLPKIQCFPGQLNQVFMNLLANAIDALEESNTKSSYQEIAENPNTIKVLTKMNPDNNCISIHFKDNGTGMSEAVKHKIFDHLFTTKAVGKGTGLGMAIAHQIIVEKHGGAIYVDSSLGLGTEFIIQLPVMEQRAVNGEL